MPVKRKRAEVLAALAACAALAWFCAVVSCQWTRNELPTSGVVCLAVFGLVYAGGFAALPITMFANICARVGPPKIRLPFMILVWAALMIPLYSWLIAHGGSSGRALVAVVFTFVGGACFGPLNAEAIVGMWFYRRAQRKLEAERPQREAEAKRELTRTLRRQQLEFDAIRAKRDEWVNEQERIQAIRNFMR